MKLICVLLLMSCLLVAKYAFALSPTMNLEGGGILGPSAAACVLPTCSGNFNATVSGMFGTSVSSAPLTMTIEVTRPCPCPSTATSCPATCPATGAAASAVSSVTSKSHNPNEEAQIRALQQQMQTLQTDVQSLQQAVSALQSGGGGGSPPVSAFARGCFPAIGTGSFMGADFTVVFFGQLCASGATEMGLFGTISTIQAPLTAGLVTWATGTLSTSGSIHIPAGGTIPFPGSGPMVVSIVGAVGQVPGLVP